MLGDLEMEKRILRKDFICTKATNAHKQESLKCQPGIF